MSEKPQSELNNKFITISVSEDFRKMVNELRWRFQMSKSRLFREALMFYVENKSEGNENEKVQGEK